LTTGMDIAQLSEFVQAMVTGAVLIAAVVIDRFRGIPLHRFGGLLRSRAGGRYRPVGRRGDAREQEDSAAVPGREERSCAE